MGDKTKKVEVQQQAVPEKTPDPVIEARKKLQAQVDSAKVITNAKDAIRELNPKQIGELMKSVNSEKADGAWKKEQLFALRDAIKEKIEVDNRVDALEGRIRFLEKATEEDRKLVLEEMGALEQRCKTLEQTPETSKISEFFKSTGGFFKDLWEKFFDKSKTAIADIGGFFGVTVPEKASDALEFVRPRGKKFMMTMIASTFGWVPEVGNWARRQIDIEDAWSAIQLATKGVEKVKPEISKSDLQNEAKWLPLQTYLNAFPGANVKEKVIQYVSLYISQQRKAKPDAEIIVSMNTLLDAQLTTNFSMKSTPAVPAVAPVQLAAAPIATTPSPTNSPAYPVKS